MPKHRSRCHPWVQRPRTWFVHTSLQSQIRKHRRKPSMYCTLTCTTYSYECYDYFLLCSNYLFVPKTYNGASTELYEEWTFQSTNLWPWCSMCGSIHLPKIPDTFIMQRWTSDQQTCSYDPYIRFKCLIFMTHTSMQSLDHHPWRSRIATWTTLVHSPQVENINRSNSFTYSDTNTNDTLRNVKFYQSWSEHSSPAHRR